MITSCQTYSSAFLVSAMNIKHPHSVKIIDCTLRDGGYYTNWDFPDAVIQEYIIAMEGVGCNCLEIGFRFPPKPGFLGACAYTKDSWLNTFCISESTLIAVMINASDYIFDGVVDFSLLETSFPNIASESRVDLVRIATHLAIAQFCIPVLDWLQARGYRVAINLMQIAGYEELELAQYIHMFSVSKPDIIYFADSLGNLNSDQASAIVNLIKSNWSGDIGIHAHDNMNMALANSLAALQSGALWVDSTLTGMGRGAGNVATELLIFSLYGANLNFPGFIPLLSLVSRFFTPLKNHYKWGPNPYYAYAARHNVHPSYVQKMLDDKRFSHEDVIAVLQHLSTSESSNFSYEKIDLAKRFYHHDPVGTWSPQSLIEGRDVIILGNGPGLQQCISAIKMFIRQRNPLVVALNIAQSIDDDIIDLRVACHPVRILTQYTVYSSLPQKIVLPYSMLPPHLEPNHSKVNILDYGLQIRDGSFDFYDTYGIIPYAKVFPYSLALSNSGHAQKIYIAGFDGYSPSDPREVENSAMINAYNSTSDSLPIISITPTTLPVPCISVYSLIE
jgi:4-hydroxy 2-oxovalerate aldolase